MKRLFLKKDRRCRRIPGFTLVELLVVVAILGILAALAAPSYRQFVVNMRMTTQANEFLTMLKLTRSEAVKRNTRVTMCKSSNGTTCTVNGDWQQGWIVFIDNSTAAGSATGTRGADEEILRVRGALSDESRLIGNGGVVNYVSYVSNGQTRNADNSLQGGTLTLCPKLAMPSGGRSIVVTLNSGRTRVDSDYPDCT